MMTGMPETSVAMTSHTLFGPAGLGFAMALSLALGACVGSFVNASALRLVRDEDFILARSRCRGCDRQLGVLENLPVLGFLRNAGKCLCGKNNLSPRYLLTELLFALLLASYCLALPTAQAIGFSLVAICLGIALLTDLEAMILHPAILVIAGGIGLAFAGAGHAGLITWHIDITEAIGGGVTGALVPLVINAGYRFFRGQSGFGAGDFWLCGVIGIWFGPLAGGAVFLLACNLGAVAGLYLISRKQASSQTRLPFGTFLGIVFLLSPNAYPFLF